MPVYASMTVIFLVIIQLDCRLAGDSRQMPVHASMAVIFLVIIQLDCRLAGDSRQMPVHASMTVIFLVIISYFQRFSTAAAYRLRRNLLTSESFSCKLIGTESMVGN